LPCFLYRTDDGSVESLEFFTFDDLRRSDGVPESIELNGQTLLRVWTAPGIGRVVGAGDSPSRGSA
jgi:hypothetical protein